MEPKVRNCQAWWLMPSDGPSPRLKKCTLDECMWSPTFMLQTQHLHLKIILTTSLDFNILSVKPLLHYEFSLLWVGYQGQRNWNVHATQMVVPILHLKQNKNQILFGSYQNIMYFLFQICIRLLVINQFEIYPTQIVLHYLPQHHRKTHSVI